MPGEETDSHHGKDHAGHDEYACKRPFYLGENKPEGYVQYHDLNRKPHLIVYQEYSEEAADYFAESEMHAGSDVVQQCIGQIDVIADEERNEDREDPSSHEALDIVLISHPSLYETESGTEEEKRDREDAVIVEEPHVSGIITACIQCNDGLVEDDEDSQGALDLFAGYTIEERLFIRRPARRSDKQDRAEDGYANVKGCRIFHLSPPSLSE